MRLEESIGNTPLIELPNFSSNKNVKLFAKMEGNNPGGSVKDRAALHMIKTAWDQGKLSKGDHIIEATSGNTGIALAMIASIFKLKITIVIPENATMERIKTMRAYGANLVLTPAEKTIEYARLEAIRLAKKFGYFTLDQFSNENNPNAHCLGTGPEIWNDTNQQVTHFVSAMGTTGTIMGVSRFLKEKNPAIQVIGAQPKDGARIPGIRKWSPALVPKIYQRDRVDRLIELTAEDATAGARKLALEFGIIGGMSSGGAFSAAMKVATEIDKGVVVFIVCDRGERYLSSELYD